MSLVCIWKHLDSPLELYKVTIINAHDLIYAGVHVKCNCDMIRDKVLPNQKANFINSNHGRVGIHYFISTQSRGVFWIKYTSRWVICGHNGAIKRKKNILKNVIYLSSSLRE